MRKVLNFRCRDLVQGQFGGRSGVCLDMLLQDQSVWISFLANQTLMKGPHWGADLMDAHVSLQIAFCCKASLAYLTSVGALARVCPVVHLEGRLARQHLVANDALIRIGQLVTEAVDKMFQLASFPLLVNLNEVLPLLIGVVHLHGEHVRQEA